MKNKGRVDNQQPRLKRKKVDNEEPQRKGRGSTTSNADGKPTDRCSKTPTEKAGKATATSLNGTSKKPEN